MSNIKHLPDILRVCSVLPALIVMPAVAAEYTSDDIKMFPYSIKYGDSLLVTEGISNAENGVFHNQGNLTINDDLVFGDNNTGSVTEPGFGAVIHMRNNKDTTKTIIGNNVVFSGGTALYEGSNSLQPGMGGAIYSWSDGPLDGVSVIEMGDNVVFRNNTAVDGSAIYTYGYNTVTIGDNLLMENNSATGGNGAFMVNGYDAIYGTDFINTVTIGKNATFKNNTAVYRAGAFYVGGDTNDKAIFDDGAFFAKNSSSYGGAIAGFGVFEFGDVTFDSNFAFDAWDHVFKNVEGAKESDYTNYVGNGGAVLNRGSLAIKGNANFLNNHAEGYGGAIYNGVGATTDISGASALFSVNTTEAKGGAIYNYTGAVAISSDNTVFRENKATNAGGAVYSDAGNLIFNGDVAFYDNQATAYGKGIGGAVALDNGAKAIFNGETVFVGNKSAKGGAALNVDKDSVAIFNEDVLFTENETLPGGYVGSAIYNEGKITFNDDFTLKNNKTRVAALYNYGTVEFGGDVLVENDVLHNYLSLTETPSKMILTGDGDVTFVNSKISNPGIEYDTSKKAVVGGLVEFRTTGDISFSGDKVDTGSGAFVNSTILSDMILQADKISVSGGRADGYAGAIFNAGNMSFLAQENLFTDNHQTAVAAENKYYKLGGGALYNRGTEYAAQMTIGFADGSSKNTFASNTALQNGGAIESRTDDPNSSAVVDIIGTTLFSKNEAGVNGGAIMNWTDADATSSTTVNFVGNAAFAENIAGANGGAIFNGGLNATVDMSKAIASFSGNKATVDGGAIYNATNAVLKIGDAKFVNNRASYGSWESEGYGGAIFANGDLDIVSEKVNGVMFSNNAAFSGGAVYGSMNSTIGMNLENVLFVGNHAIADAGALGIFNNDVSKLTNVVFRNNTVAVAVDGLIAEDDIKEADGGGAIQLGGTASADLVKTHFVGNESGVRGGAISARHGTGYELNITDSSFTNNKSATNGGSIANVFAGAVSIKNVNFIGNKANERGGAIYNGQDWNFGSGDGGAMSSGDGIVNISGTNVFSGNIAGDLGGAIFNGADGVINMTGINTFVNNTANGGANDIYNDGTLNIAADTKVVISGGIKGNGTLTLAGDATLDIGTSLVEQDKISIDGTVVASIVSGRSYGRLSSDNLAFGENAVLQLNIGSVGTYDIFGDGKKYDVDILVGDTYIATETDRGIVIEIKSVADIAEDAGLTVETAGTVANLANSADRNLQKLSLLAQQALNSDNSALVEKETAKLAPEDENMTRSVAMSAQSQALSLASGRMMGGMGRAGGDKSQTNGFWAQGLFNKTKYADQFHGYSRGFAVGADTTIDRKYTIGAGLTHTNSDVHSGSRHTDISTTTLFAYGQYKPTDWFLNGTLVYAMSEYDENIDPFGVQINSLYNANSFGAQAMTGYALKSGLTPQVGIRYLHIEQDEYNNGVNRMNAMDYEYLSGVAGFAYSFNINNARSALQLKPELRAMLTYDLVQDNSVATVVMNNINSSYIVDGENLSRVGGEFGVGLTATYNGVDVSVMYDITLHEDYTSQTGMIKFRGQF